MDRDISSDVYFRTLITLVPPVKETLSIPPANLNKAFASTNVLIDCEARPLVLFE